MKLKIIFSQTFPSTDKSDYESIKEISDFDFKESIIDAVPKIFKKHLAVKDKSSRWSFKVIDLVDKDNSRGICKGRIGCISGEEDKIFITCKYRTV